MLGTKQVHSTQMQTKVILLLCSNIGSAVIGWRIQHVCVHAFVHLCEHMCAAATEVRGGAV